MRKKVIQIKSFETYSWLKKLHYARRLPSICYAFGLYEDLDLIGVITYGMPASNSLCIGLCGEQFKEKVKSKSTKPQTEFDLEQKKNFYILYLIANL